MRLLSAILLFYFLHGSLPAQNQSGRIQGIVVDSGNGLPLADVRVQAKGPKSVSVTTGSDGRFVLEDLTAGLYQVVTVSDRYSPVRGTWRTVKPEDPTASLTLSLIPWGIASGIVMDSNGKPVTNAVVMAYRRGFGTDGSPSLRLDPDRQNSQSTNDRGEFRLYRLDPGEYYFHVEPPGDGPPMTTRGQAFWPVYYPGTTEANRAAAIRINPGEEVRLGSVTVLPSSNSILRLHIVNLSGETLSKATRTVTFRPAPAQISSFIIVGVAAAPESDVIEFHGLPQGPHEILVSWNTSKGTVQGLATVETTTSDSDAELRVRAGSRIAGLALDDRIDGAAPIQGLSCQLQSNELMPSRLLSTLTGTSAKDGAFSIDNVPQAEYRVQCSGLPAGSSIRGIRLNNGGDAPSPLVDRFRVEAETRLSVIVATSTAGIQGRVSGSDGKSVQGATVVLEPDSAAPARNHLYRTAMTDQNGTYVITDVIAGSYRLFAWHELRDPAYMNEEFMKTYRQSGKLVQVDAGGHLEANLTVLE